MESSESAANVISILDDSEGYGFEKAVKETFSFLDFEAYVVEGTEAESDVIAKAPLAKNPYFVIIECCAVRESNEVPYAKLGQIRGNYVKYVTKKEFAGFETNYLAVVGKPSFSQHAIENSDGVTLLTVENLKSLVNLHDTYCFTQDELEEAFDPEGGLVTDFSNLERIGSERHKRIDLYALIYVTLGCDIGVRMYRRRWTPIMHLIGSVRFLGGIFGTPIWTEEEVDRAILDMTSPLIQVLEVDQEEDSVRMASLPLSRIVSSMGQKGQLFLELVKAYQSKFAFLSSQGKLADRIAR